MDSRVFQDARGIGMSADDDLEKITKPVIAPPEEPDRKTTAEATELSRKAKTPLEREAEAHASHLDTMRGQIAFHSGECVELRRENAELRKELTNSQAETKRLGIENANLQATRGAVGCMSLLGTLLALFGGGVLSYAGGHPDLSANEKTAYCSSGMTLLVAGMLILAIGYLVSWWQKKP
jgi:hypothetical protein